MSRTDIHRPSAIDPTAYRFVTVLYLGGADADPGLAIVNANNRKLLADDMARTGGRYATHEHGGTCHVCGAVAMYVAIYQHTGTLDYIRMGEDCATKMDMGDVAAFNPVRRAIADARAAIAGKRKAAATLADAGLGAAWALYETRGDVDALLAAGACTARPGFDGALCHTHTWEYRTLLDIVGKLVKYGSISDKQTAFLAGLLDKIANARSIAAAREAERANAQPCPTGRVVVEGVVVKFVEQDSRFGTAWKMTVRAAAGWLVWGTAPAALGDEVKVVGSRVRFTATVAPSTNDPVFGFFKRPTGLVVVAPANKNPKSFI
jgi:hypothetical protein